MHRRTREDGYTLIELMVVVAVIGVLAAVAIPSFTSYLMRAKTTEAVTFLGEIRQRQESYRAEFGSYCAASGGADITGATWNPTTDPGNFRMAFDPGAGDWDQLGAQPDGLSYFQYRTTAGAPGAASGTGVTPTDFWFVAQARGDLDGDNANVTFEAYSWNNQIFVMDDSNGHLGAGWE